MSSEWSECSLGDLIDIKHGFAFSGDYISKNQGKFVLVTPGNFEIGGGFKEGSAKYFHSQYPEEYVFSPGDLVVTMTDLSKTADTLGYSAKIPGEKGKTYLHNQRVGKVSSKSSDAELDFLYWVMRHTDYRRWVLSTATGSTVKHTSPSRILDYTFLLPPLPEQQAIAHILGTLDDKIELNRKTNETLEAMAQALFKSWFVDFDPVRAKAEGRPTGLPDEISDLFPDSFEDSELGEIPSGWKVSSLGEEFQWKEGKPWVKEDRVDFSANLVFGANGSIGYSTRQIANTRVIFVGKIGSCGAINFYNGSFWATNNTHYLTLEDNSDLEYIRQVLLGVDFSAYVGGSSNPYMPFGNFAQHQIASPPSRIISKYCEEVSPARSRIEQNTTESSLLSFLRDALLPKLISGEIRIPDAERLLEEVGV